MHSIQKRHKVHKIRVINTEYLDHLTHPAVHFLKATTILKQLTDHHFEQPLLACVCVCVIFYLIFYCGEIARTAQMLF